MIETVVTKLSDGEELVVEKALQSSAADPREGALETRKPERSQAGHSTPDDRLLNDLPGGEG